MKLLQSTYIYCNVLFNRFNISMTTVSVAAYQKGFGVGDNRITFLERGNGSVTVQQM